MQLRKVLERDLTQNLMYQGMNLSNTREQRLQRPRRMGEKRAEEAAEFRVKAGLTLAELSKALKSKQRATSSPARSTLTNAVRQQSRDGEAI